jgi:ADP-ribosyl-[dinitrogen reductase] hydrolase
MPSVPRWSFVRREPSQPLDDMNGGGPFNLRPGEMDRRHLDGALPGGEPHKCGEFDPVDQMARYVRWKREGYHSSNGSCFDVGGTVCAALARFERYSEPWSGSTDELSADNGSIMRVAPVPLFSARTPGIAIARSADSSRTTHGAREAIDACRYMDLIIGALQGRSNEELLARSFTPVAGLWLREPLAPRVHAVATESADDNQVGQPRVEGTAQSLGDRPPEGVFL